MLRQRDRHSVVFSLSALDLFAMGMGIFILIAVVLMPYYRNYLTAYDHLKKMEQAEYAAVNHIQQLDSTTSGLSAEIIRMSQEINQAQADINHMRNQTDSLKNRVRKLNRQRSQVETASLAKKSLPVSKLDSAENDPWSVSRIRALDLVFVIDATQSMHETIDELARRITTIIRILYHIVPSIRVGMVAYRDYDLPGELLRILPLTEAMGPGLTHVNDFIKALHHWRSPGGKSPEEALLAGMRAAHAMLFRRDARRTVIIISDAAAHQHEREAALALARNFSDQLSGSSLSTLHVATQAWKLYGKDDRAFFSALARAGGGQAFQLAGRLVESVLLSVLIDNSYPS